MLPEAGGEYVYLREAYGPLWGFLYSWTQMWVAKSGSIATLATGFFVYLENFLSGAGWRISAHSAANCAGRRIGCALWTIICDRADSLIQLLVWDKVLGLGTTDPLAGFASTTSNLVVSFYFAKRGFENVARIIKR